MSRTIALVLLVLLAPAAWCRENNPFSPAAPTNTVSTNALPLSGKPVSLSNTDRLMRELGREPYRSTAGRRFEITFFISLPVTLWVTWTLMKFMTKYVRDYDNPAKELRTPHYVFMLSTSLVTSFYIAAEDARRHPPDKVVLGSGPAVRETYVDVPVIGVRW